MTADKIISFCSLTDEDKKTELMGPNRWYGPRASPWFVSTRCSGGCRGPSASGCLGLGW